jgi:hypothetical protein
MKRQQDAGAIRPRFAGERKNILSLERISPRGFLRRLVCVFVIQQELKLGFEDAIQQPAIDRLFEECAKLWGLEKGSVLSVPVTLDYLPLTVSNADEFASPEQQLECEMLCRTFMRRFKERTAAYGTIRTNVSSRRHRRGLRLFVRPETTGWH